MEDTSIHCPAIPVYYEELSSIDGVTHIRVPDDKPKYPFIRGLSRRDRALLVVEIKKGEIDLRDLSAADLAHLLRASPRSVSAAAKLSIEERRAVADGQRPLFLHRSTSSPATPATVESPITAVDHLKLAINGLGIEGVLVALALAESEATMKVAA